MIIIDGGEGKAGHRDIIDNVLNASSVRFGLMLLALSAGLRFFNKEKRQKNTLTSPTGCDLGGASA